MSNNGVTQVPPNSTGNQIDCSSLSVGGVTAYRQRIVIADNAHSANFATVSAGSLQVIVENASLAVTGQVSVTGSVAISNTVTVQGQVSAVVTGTVALSAGTNHIGEVNISLMPAVVVTSITNQVQISNISATVNVAGTLTIGGTTGGTSSTAGSSFTLIGGNDGSIGRVALMDAAGHQIISGTVALTTLNGLGKIDGISAAVVLAAGTNNIGTLNNISAAVVLAAGAANIGSINNISANVNVVLQAGTNNIGSINNISAVVSVNLVAMSAAALPVLIAAQSAGLAIRTGGRVKTSSSSTVSDSNTVPLWMDKNGRQVVVMNHPSLPPSVSHGPKVVNVSTSASVALLPAQGSGVQNYVDSLLVTNGSGTLTNWTAYEVSATGTPICGAYLAASGGGFTHYFNPPWRVSANTVLNMRVKPNASKVEVTIHFHVGVD